MSATQARGDDRKAEEILKEIDAVKPPTLDQSKVQDRAYVQKYIAEQRKAMTTRAELIGELYKVDPANEQLVKLLPARWMAKLQSGGDAKAVTTEIDEVLAGTKIPALKIEAAFSKAQLPMMTGRADESTTLKNIDEFTKLAPKDERAGDLLYAATRVVADEAKQTELLNRIVKEYPKSRGASQAKGTLRKLDGIGKPFDLEFTEAISGSEISMKGLKGKVVVIDFWATWCGPCVAEMPKMKKLYAEYKDKGVEFIGVSLDQPKDKGGLDKLKEFVPRTRSPGRSTTRATAGRASSPRPGASTRSLPSSWSTPTASSTRSRPAGKLETMIPELLKKANTKADAGGGGN